ncbi:LOW QUALITY PROTEIN: inner nuclear membrane protein Man1-like [Pecten maximus]|uniref:LOW QUALITY PROTEIN: inner nuclear membrane protein Man1-like n=1 Tax=Pecten maximus TaxID=6579 RepID=UPI0014588F47|nr:LOW QUALITY PROTEIN: inner nuclear membrane protein Man1-like [Pecten maximus]
MADKLSDVELVEELRRFGEEVKQPIDRKKRPILVKKLNHLRARENASNRLKKATNSRKKQNVEFSSEDESEIEDVAAPTTASRLSGRKSLRQNTSAYSSITDTIEMSPNTKRTNSRSRRSITSAKDPPVVNSSQTNTPGPSGSARLYPDLGRFSDADNAKSKGRGWKYQRNTNAGEDSYDYKGDFSDSDPEESMYEVVNKSMNTTFPVAESAARNEEEDDDDADEDDIVNDNRDFNTRFSTRLRGRHEVSKNNSSKKTTTSQTKQSKTSNHVNSFTEEEIRQYGFKTHEDSQKMKPPVASYVSTGILIIVAVFFASLGMLYIYMRGDLLHGISNVFSSTGENGFVHLPKCENNKDKDCYSDSEADIALDLVTTLESFLKSKTGEDENPSCSVEEAKEEILVKEQKKLKEYNSEKVFTGTLMLILKNPYWNIRVLTVGNASASTVEDIFRLETDPDLSLVVRVYGALYKILLGVVLLLSCFVIMMMGVLVLRHRQKSKEEERKKVFEIVEKIIDMVKENFDTNEQDSRQPSYMAVQHVRDQLLPPSQRRQMVPLWEKAVKFIEANESRIRVETQNIQGEDFLVWRWLPTNSSCGKVWQGQAFGENNVSAGNTLQYSPTPCLKIRNMFDADVETADDWDVNVQDAVLEKCKGITGILHIFVDRASSQGCVYMKCDSCETAYQVYRSLHGWWFDGRLVTVKYLRLELYHDRFPNSKKNIKPLLPSNNSMASLSHPYHRSLLEMT